MKIAPSYFIYLIGLLNNLKASELELKIWGDIRMGGFGGGGMEGRVNFLF
jgi:hypothetical protein